MNTANSLNSNEQSSNIAAETNEGDAEPPVNIPPSSHTAEPPAKHQKGDRKDKVTRVRDAGKSLLPIARVQRIVKADKACLAFGFKNQVANLTEPCAV
jgi:hypothetical protein